MVVVVVVVLGIGAGAGAGAGPGCRSVSSRRAQKHKSTYFIGIYVLLLLLPNVW